MKNNVKVDLHRYRGLYFADVFTGAYPGGVDAALSATRRRRPVPELVLFDNVTTTEAAATPSLDAPTLPLNGSTTSWNETRPRCLATTLDAPTLTFHDITIVGSETHLSVPHARHQIYNPSAA